MFGGTKSKITDEQVQYIKSHRNIPEYVLYDDFSDIIGYEYFKMIYRDEERKEIRPTVEMYPNNLNFSCQMIKSKLTYYEIINLRNQYNNGVYWKDAYIPFKNRIAESTFWDTYVGHNFKFIMPEVFTIENKKYRTHLSHSGEKNSKAKITVKDVKEIRRLFNEEHKSKKEIATLYPEISYASVVDIINYRSWKDI